jgi:hypothetical protein
MNPRIEKLLNYLKETPQDAFLNHALGLEYIKENQLTTLPDLPKKLTQLYCDENIYEYYGRIINNNFKDFIEKVNQQNADES